MHLMTLPVVQRPRGILLVAVPYCATHDHDIRQYLTTSGAVDATGIAGTTTTMATTAVGSVS